MPITLNHSNIGVQYNTGSNYIIETVKSDLYLRNEIYNTIVSNNIQAAPVTPSIYIENTSNVYAIESYTYTGSANTADYTRVFPKNTVCDILVVGGGGAGDRQIGGGGGGGAVLYATNITIPANTYTIKVGKGGESGNGGNSEAFGATCLGGGSTTYVVWGSQNNGTAGGSGSGGSSGSPTAATATGGTVGVSTKGALLTSGTLYNGNVGGNGLPQHSSGHLGSGGGGGAGTAGFNSSQTLYTTRSSGIAGGRPSKGGDGVAINITGATYYWGAGGGGAGHISLAGDGGLGGGGGGGGEGSIIGLAGTDGINNGINGSSSDSQNGGNGAPNTGSGGGGGGYNGGSGAYNGGAGGSGIVIIRYLLGTIPTNNLLTTAPIVSPNIYPVKTNIFTHSGGSEAQTSYTINFPNNTVCDILIIGGGGGGGNGDGTSWEPGGGGAGGIVYMVNKTLSSGTYKINVGKGGASNTDGNNSTITDNNNNALTFDSISLIGKGGGKGATSTSQTGSDGGSGGGGGNNMTNGGLATQGNTFWNGTSYVAGGFNGGKATAGSRGGGGGGAGELGDADGAGFGGDGVQVNITGVNTFYAGGGNAFPNRTTTRSDGGGGLVPETGNPVSGGNALPDTGSGGSGAYGVSSGGSGGSGIVVIRVREGYFTESTRMFVHNGSSDSQATYNINMPEDTICDMLIVAGGGGGGMDMGGGGGGGGVIELNNVLVTAGTYTIKVGKGGDGAPAAGTNGQPNSHLFRFNGKQGTNSSFDNYVAIGGGYGGSSPHSHRLQGQGGDGGSGGGSSGYEPVNNVSKAGKGVEGQGFRGGYGGQAHYSGGGGGAGEVGGGPSTAAGGAYGGRGKLSNILGTPYYWAGGGGGSGYSTTGGNGGLGGGGGGAVGTTTGGTGYFNGFAGGGGSINAQTNTPGGNGAPHTGGGGGGGSHYTSNNKGGDGGSGIVIIKLKSLSKIGKTADTKILNFAYDPVISFDPGKRAEYQAQLKTGVGGWRIVRFLPPTSTTSWYPISDNLTGTTLLGISYSYTNYWTVPFGTFDEFVFATLNMNYWLHCTKTTAYASYSNTAANIIKSSFSSTPYTALWYNRGTVASPEDPLISIQNYGTQVVYAENGANGNPKDMIPLDGGMCVLVRDSTASTLVPSTTYTLNFPVPTLTNINTINNVILEGEYDITINNNSSSIVSKTGKHIPKFASSISAPTIGISYNLLKPVLDPTGAQWTYNSSNINVYHMGSVGIGTTIPEYQLDVRGTIYSSLGGYTSSALTKWSVLSDRRIKENIVKASYDKCLENVKNIELYNFNFKDNCVNTNDMRQLGFIAQEVQQVYPKAVEVSKMILNLEEKIDDLLTLNITQIDYTLYGAVKSLIEKMENIKIKMEQIKTAYDIP